MAKQPHGFTLIEVLVVLGIFAVVAGLAVSAGLHTHSGFTAKDDEDVAIATLQKARSQSMAGVCVGSNCTAALAHGVHVNARSLVLFQGSSFNPADDANEMVSAQSNATTFAGTDSMFAPYSGDVDATGTIRIFDNGSPVATVTVGTNGAITWDK